MMLSGSRCVLRPWRRSDADPLVRHANNINVARQLRDRFPHPYTRDHAREFLEAVAGAEPPTNFAIEVAGEAGGGLGFVAGRDVERYSAEVGYWLGEALWNRGIASEALELFTRYAFDRLRLLRLFALPLADNTASIRVLEKAGFAREGTLRAACVKYGEPRDQVMYARINGGWSP